MNSLQIETLLLISPERCSECKCDFAKLFLKAKIIRVKNLKLMLPFLHVLYLLQVNEVTNFYKVACKFGDKCNNF